MKEDFSRLSKYNPLCISNMAGSNGDFCAEISLFLAKDKNSLYNFDIPSLLKEKELVNQIYLMTTRSNSMDVFAQKFSDLVGTLTNFSEDNDELFWDYIFVLEQIILKDSIIKECREIITQNLEKLIDIFSEAKKRESTLQKESAKKLSKYAIMSFYVSNKFKTGSDTEDDVLFEFLLNKFFNSDDFDLELFASLSVYKNCDKFDLSWQDVLEEFMHMNDCAVDYSWIFIPYLLRYKAVFENVMLSTVGDDIYDAWFSYLLSKDYLSDTIEKTDAEIKEECKKTIDAFKLAGIYTYEYNRLIGQVMKERRNLWLESK